MKSVLLVVLMLLLPVQPAGGTGCKPTCKQVYLDTLQTLCPVCSREVVDTRTACFGAIGGIFDDCVDACPPFPGRCTLTLECVKACRTARSRQQARCERQFQHQLLAQCDVSLSCLAAASQAQRDCRKSCRGHTPVTTTTTTTALAAVLAKGCPRDTQRECVFQITEPCYGECNDRCGGDQRALKICRRGCRNAVCGLLRGACTDNTRDQSAAYRQRCHACGDCQEQLADAVACETTTTSTTSTSTSSSSTASSVTTTSTSTTSSTIR